MKKIIGWIMVLIGLIGFIILLNIGNVFCGMIVTAQTIVGLTVGLPILINEYIKDKVTDNKNNEPLKEKKEKDDKGEMKEDIETDEKQENKIDEKEEKPIEEPKKKKKGDKNKKAPEGLNNP